ncbi:hypothetical protein [uncultured Aquabacterium sp.]|uniref:hypothetical protein n=1 Tax=Aquabacterium sp. TaxID=1872578 RepID=UPI0025D68DD7|nr:hypothetical protein [uncultured Aquabacterium sp.]
MIVVQPARSWRNSVLGVGLLTLAMLSVWMYTSPSGLLVREAGIPAARAQAAPTDSPALHGRSSAPGPQSLAPLDAVQLEAQQAAAVARLSSQPLRRSEHHAVVTSRPDYVSDVEWAMLKGVAGQHAHPEAELTRLVHVLHFHKQLERWEKLGPGDPLPLRRELAEWVLAEMPERVRRGDLGIAEAQARVRGLVRDAESGEAARTDRLTLEWGRLRAAAAAMQGG